MKYNKFIKLWLIWFFYLQNT